VVAHPEAVAHDGGKANVDTSSVARRKVRRSARHRARTNAGKFLSLQADYRSGRLTEEGEERYEALCLLLSRLYRERP
jgi:hypothetical protein